MLGACHRSASARGRPQANQCWPGIAAKGDSVSERVSTSLTGPRSTWENELSCHCR